MITSSYKSTTGPHRRQFHGFAPSKGGGSPHPFGEFVVSSQNFAKMWKLWIVAFIVGWGRWRLRDPQWSGPELRSNSILSYSFWHFHSSIRARLINDGHFPGYVCDCFCVPPHWVAEETTTFIRFNNIIIILRRHRPPLRLAHLELQRRTTSLHS